MRTVHLCAPSIEPLEACAQLGSSAAATLLWCCHNMITVFHYPTELMTELTGDR